MKFWDVVREISTQPIRKEAVRPFVLALAGNRDMVARARALALGNLPTALQIAEAEPFLYPVSSPYNDEAEKRLRHADLLVSLPGGPGLTDFRPADTLTVPNPDHLVREVLRHRPDLRLALGRRLPGFRPLAAEYVIRDVSKINAEFAAVSGLGQAIPYLAPIFPIVAGTDIVMLTKNQVMLVFRLAALYGEDMDFISRLREVLPVIGGSLGWRTIARQLAGMVPGGFGLPMRVGIAYSGTYATGRAAQVVFERGFRPSGREMKVILQDAALQAKEATARVLKRPQRDTPALEARTADPADIETHLADSEAAQEQKSLPKPELSASDHSDLRA